MKVNFDTVELEDSTLPRTEDSAERGLVPEDPRTHDPVTYANLGRSEGLGDEAGDIADEGSGHRG